MAFPVVVLVNMHDISDVLRWLKKSEILENAVVVTTNPEQAEAQVAIGAMRQQLILGLIRGDEDTTLKYVRRQQGKNPSLEVLLYTSDAIREFTGYNGRVQKQRSHFLMAINVFLASRES